MRYLISPDSFKGSISSIDASLAIAKGIRKSDPDAVIHICPMADGGEGTLFALTNEDERIKVPSKNSIGKKNCGYIGIKKDYAVIEMAQAVGLNLVKPEERNPELSTTCGVGMLIDKAIEMGSKNIILCVGGSGTNDGGAGLIECLGGLFYDENGKQLQDIRAKDLSRVSRVDFSRVKEKLKGINITVASDVKNTLLGADGASRVYGPQKGADPDMVERLENSLSCYADVLERSFNKKVRDIPGTGAGGGICYSLMFIDNVKIVSGAEAVISHQKIDILLDETDILITGEGSIDKQSLYGKTIDVLCSLAQKKNVPVVIFAGRCSDKEEILSAYPNIKTIKTLMEIAKDKEDSKKHASKYLKMLAVSEFGNLS